MSTRDFSSNSPKEKIPLHRALFWIFLSVVVVSGPIALGWLYYLHLHAARANDESYRIVAIVQTSPTKETLHTVYLAQLMDLSVDRPSNIYSFNTQLAEQKLRESPFIKWAEVKTIKPGIVHVDYTVRQPLAALHDYANTAMDAEGYIFPITPFFTPKKLPEIYLGLPPFGQAADGEGPEGGHWGVPLKGRGVELALSLLELLSAPHYRDLFSVRWIDVSNAYADSYGQRQIILTVEDHVEKVHDETMVFQAYPRILRLSTKNYPQELGNYLQLRKNLLQQEEQEAKGDQVAAKQSTMTIDLRIPQLAFIGYH